MKNIRYVCLFSILAAGQSIYAPSATGQSTAAAAVQQMQRGVSVKMAMASDALPMPEADDQEAWIVTVTEDGDLYFGTDSFSSNGLRQQMISHPRRREQRLYIKADAGAKFSSAQAALQAARAAGFGTVVLLTTRARTSNRVDRISPEGLEVRLNTTERSGPIAVDASGSGMENARLAINHTPTSLADLPVELSHVVTKEGSVLVRADADLAYLQVVRVLDACRLAGARVVLAIDSGR